jgi:hypothetical protein
MTTTPAFQSHTVTLSIFTRCRVEKRSYWPEGQQYQVTLDDDHHRGHKVLATRCDKATAQAAIDKVKRVGGLYA